MLANSDIWRAALATVHRYGADTMLEAAARADKLLEEGYPVAATAWHRIRNAIERLQATKPAGREKLH